MKEHMGRASEGDLVRPGAKHDQGKLRFSLLPLVSLREVIRVLEFGAGKYAPNNWQQVPDARTRYYDALMRHVMAWHEGEQNDPETGMHHLAHAACCALFAMWFDLVSGQQPNNSASACNKL